MEGSTGKLLLMKNFHFVVLTLALIGSFTTGCLSKPLDCGRADVFCVGLVTNVGRLYDSSTNQAAWDGIQQAKADGLADWTASIESMDARDYQANIRVLAEAGYDVIVTSGSAMGEATRAVAREYPQLHFIAVDQEQLPDQEFIPNLVGLVFAEDQIGYLAGAMAALMSKTGFIGAVLASDELPNMKRYGEGFRAGAISINPDIYASIIYHNEVGLDKTLDDPEWGSTRAKMLVDSGVDILFGSGGTTGTNALGSAMTLGAYGIGADTDQYNSHPGVASHLIVSVLKMIGPGLEQLIQTARASQTGTSIFPAGNYFGQVGLSSYHDMDSSIPEEVKLRISDLNQALNSGEIQTGGSITNP
jgi:basic membrane protein A